MQITWLNLLYEIFIGLKWSIIFSSFFFSAAWFVNFLIKDDTRQKIAKKVGK
jgi:hypothetical protein